MLSALKIAFTNFLCVIGSQMRQKVIQILRVCLKKFFCPDYRHWHTTNAIFWFPAEKLATLTHFFKMKKKI